MPADAKSPKKLRNNRAALTHKTGYALRRPGRTEGTEHQVLR